MTRDQLVDQLSQFVCDPRAGATITLTLDRDGAWEALGALAYTAPGVVLHAQNLARVTEALEAHASVTSWITRKSSGCVASHALNRSGRVLENWTLAVATVNAGPAQP